MNHQLTPRARLVAAANAGVDPAVMGIGPGAGHSQSPRRSGWSTRPRRVEVNEAIRVAGAGGACRDLDLDTEIVNETEAPSHSATPRLLRARLVITCSGRLERRYARGLATMCVGVGQGSALLLECP